MGDSVTQLPLKDFYVREQTLLFLPLLLIIRSFTIKIYIFRFGLNATGVIGWINFLPIVIMLISVSFGLYWYIWKLRRPGYFVTTVRVLIKDLILTFLQISLIQYSRATSSCSLGSLVQHEILRLITYGLRRQKVGRLVKLGKTNGLLIKLMFSGNS